MKESFKRSLLVASSFPFMLFIVSPLTFYWGNRQEYHFQTLDALPLLLVASVLATVIIALCLAGISRYGRIARFVSGLVVSAATCVWIQSQLFAWDFGPLDGRGISWEEWQSHEYTEWAVWFLVLTTGSVLSLAKLTINRTHAQIILLAGTLSLATSLFAGVFLSAKSEHRSPPSIPKLTEFHSEKNVLVVIFDTFQANAFDQIVRQHPEDIESLDGFTYFRNTLAGYPTTYPSIPLLLTGAHYKNQEPINDFIRRANREGGLPTHYLKKGFDVDIAALVGWTVSGLQATRARVHSTASIAAQASPNAYVPPAIAFDGGLFRAVPTTLKPFVYRNSDWLIARLFEDDKLPPDHHGVDLKMLQLIVDNSTTNSEPRGKFKVFHFFTPHFPMRVNENLEHDTTLGKTWESYIRQCRGALRILEALLDRLKSLGIYRNAEILVVGDHGTQLFDLPNTQDVAAQSGDASASMKPIAAALPVLLYKPSAQRGPLQISDRDISLGDVPCLIRQDSLDDCISDQYLGSKSQRVRRYYHYDWGQGYWSRDFMPEMTEYLIQGHAWRSESWRVGRFIFQPGKTLDRHERSTYDIGAEIGFGATGNAEQYVTFGWHRAQKNLRWIDGHNAGLRLYLNQRSPDPLVLNAILRPYLGGGKISSQTVRVFVNGRLYAKWIVNRPGEYHLAIAEQAVRDGRLDVTFQVSDPLKPCNVQDADDCRSLGVAVRRIRLSPQGERTGQG